jgi:hypothetical protein
MDNLNPLTFVWNRGDNMVDRTSAELFGNIFSRLANKQTEETIEIAKDLWSNTSGYDFSPYQMESDDALINLGLAKKIDGNIVYKNTYNDNFDEE